MGFQAVLLYLCLPAVCLSATTQSTATTSKQKTQSKSWAELPTLIRAKSVGDSIVHLVQSELEVDKIKQIYQQLSYKNRTISFENEVNELATLLDNKFAQYIAMLLSSKVLVGLLHRKQPQNLHMFKQYRECCSVAPHKLQFEPHFHTLVNETFSCDIAHQSHTAFSFYPTLNLTTVFERNRNVLANIKWQYFISADGLHVEHPAHGLDSGGDFARCVGREQNWHRNIYVSAVLPYRKAVVLLIDRSTLAHEPSRAAVHTIAGSILASLSEHDRVTIIPLGDVAPPQQHCMPTADAETVRILHEQFFSQSGGSYSKEKCNSAQLRGSCQSANHSAGFEAAFDALDATLEKLEDQLNPYIIYISRSQLGNVTAAGEVLRTIGRRNERLQNRVVISSFAVVDSQKKQRVSNSTSLLEDVAHQNYSKFKVKLNVPASPPQGQVFVINISATTSPWLSLADSLALLRYPGRRPDNRMTSQDSQREVVFTPARRDIAGGQGVVLGIATALYREAKLVGIVAMDLDVAELFDRFTYYAAPDMTYAIVIDLYGHVLSHPLYARAFFLRTNPPRPRLLSQVEEWTADEERAEKLMWKMTNEVNGTICRAVNARCYSWNRLNNAPFVAVVSSESRESTTKEVLRDVKISSFPDVTYHRLDLIPKEGLCTHFNQLCNLQYAAYFLSARCFDKPFAHLSYVSAHSERWIVQGHAAFIHDSTRLLSSPGVKTGIREQITPLSYVSKLWYRQTRNTRKSPNKLSILRRMLSSAEGVMLIHPATMLDKRNDPTRQSWFRLARPNQIHLTAPRLDPSGAGYVVTLSTVVKNATDTMQYDERPDSLYTPNHVVAALDMPPSALYHTLLSTLAACKPNTTRCFVFDDHGYVLAYPPTRQATRRHSAASTRELHHITYKEPVVAIDLLQHQPDFVRKRACVDRNNDDALMRYYEFDRTPWLVRRNSDRLQCLTYEIVAIPQTNTFLAVVNATCSDADSSSSLGALCWCSQNDDQCISCQTDEVLVDCECPCRCRQSGVGVCERYPLSQPACPPTDEPLRLPYIQPQFLTRQHIDACVKTECGDIAVRSKCLQVVGCDWCYRNPDAFSLLSKPYCSSVTKCFGGVLGASPYVDDVTKDRSFSASIANRDLVASTPIGPVAGAIMTVFGVLIIAVYCYRHQMARLLSRYASSNLTDDSANVSSQLSTGEVDPDSPNAFRNARARGHNLVLASFERDNIEAIDRIVRPMPWNRGRRRGTAATDGGQSSDHGYSTMTGPTMTNAGDTASERGVEPLESLGEESSSSKCDSKTPLLLVTADDTMTEEGDVLKEKMVPPLDMSPRSQTTTLDEENCATDVPEMTVLTTQAVVHFKCGDEGGELAT